MVIAAGSLALPIPENPSLILYISSISALWVSFDQSAPRLDFSAVGIQANPDNSERYPDVGFEKNLYQRFNKTCWKNNFFFGLLHVLDGAIAQLVEHLHGMQRVRSSNLLSSTNNQEKSAVFCAFSVSTAPLLQDYFLPVSVLPRKIIIPTSKETPRPAAILSAEAVSTVAGVSATTAPLKGTVST